MGKIVVDRGYEEFTIEDKEGNVLGKFEMNPADMELAKRYEIVAHNLQNMAEKLEESGDTVADLLSCEKYIYEQIDYLFNSNVAEKFFSITSPFSVLASGEFFVENVLNAIGGLIESETGKRMKKIQSKVSKYASKYHG